MADSVTPSILPPGFDLYAGYENGLYANVSQIQAMYPNTPVIGISVFASKNVGLCLDVENWDATPQQAPPWVLMRRASGVSNPWVYCSQAVWAQVQQEFVSQNVSPPLWWIAAYPGPGPVLYPGSIAHQWIDRGPYDESVVADFIPGVDPVPTATGDEMIASTPSGNGYWLCRSDGSVWSYGDAQYHGGTNPGTPTPMPAGHIATGFASHPTQQGYWISTDHNEVYAFGAAGYHGP